MKHPTYTLSRFIVATEECYGPVHYAENPEFSLCGQRPNTGWWILTNNRSGTATCKKCIAAASKTQPPKP